MEVKKYKLIILKNFNVRDRYFTLKISINLYQNNIVFNIHILIILTVSFISL